MSDLSFLFSFEFLRFIPCLGLFFFLAVGGREGTGRIGCRCPVFLTSEFAPTPFHFVWLRLLASRPPQGGGSTGVLSSVFFLVLSGLFFCVVVVVFFFGGELT